MKKRQQEAEGQAASCINAAIAGKADRADAVMMRDVADQKEKKQREREAAEAAKEEARLKELDEDVDLEDMSFVDLRRTLEDAGVPAEELDAVPEGDKAGLEALLEKYG
jgi:hypothetical protein